MQKFSVNIVKLVSGDSKTPSPVPGLVSGRLSKPELSSASKVLNEEIQKQQAQENDRLKDLIIKEVRKLGKSTFTYMCRGGIVAVYVLYFQFMVIHSTHVDITKVAFPLMGST